MVTTRSKVRKITKKKTALKKGAKLQAFPGAELELDGSVYLIEYDKHGKETSRAEIDGKAVLDSVLYVLHQMLKKRKTP